MMKRLAAEGMIAGTIGAAVVAVWFLMYDMAHGRPFTTPALLGAVLFQGLRDVGSLRITPTLVLEYSLVHWAAFVLVGCTAAVLLAAADRIPGLVAGRQRRGRTHRQQDQERGRLEHCRGHGKRLLSNGETPFPTEGFAVVFWDAGLRKEGR